MSVVIYDPAGITVIADIGTRGPQGIPGVSPSGNFTVDYLSLTATDISEKKVTLGGVPVVPEKTILDVITGVAQVYETDFIIIGDQLSWAGLGLDGKLIEGEQLRIEYFI